MKILRALVFICSVSIVCAGESDRTNILVPGENPLPSVSRSKILMDVRVTDKEGNPLKGLTAENFQISQDGRKQPINEFYQFERSDGKTDPRIVVFLIDDVGLKKEKYDQVRTAIRHFTDSVMQPTDMAGIARTAGGGVVIQPLTSDAEELRSAIEQWQFGIETVRPSQNISLATRVSSISFVSACSGST